MKWGWGDIGGRETEPSTNNANRQRSFAVRLLLACICWNGSSFHLESLKVNISGLWFCMAKHAAIKCSICAYSSDERIFHFENVVRNEDV